MIKNNRRSFFFFLFALSAMPFSACKQVEEDFSKYPVFPLQLTYEEPAPNSNQGLKLKWNKINTSDFVQYFVVKSTTDSIPELKAGIPLSTGFTIATIKDPTKTDATDFSFSSQSRIYYRVFAQLGTRFVSSQNVILNANVTALKNQNYDFAYNSKKNLLYLVDRNTSNLSLYDVNKNAVIKGVKINVYSSNNYFLALGQYNGLDEVYVLGTDAGSNATIYIYDAATLDFKDFIPLNSSSIQSFSLAADNSGVIYAHNTVGTPKMNAYSRETKALLSGNATTTYSMRIKRLSEGKILGLPNASNLMYLYQFDDAGQYAKAPISAFATIVPPNNNVNNTIPLAVSPTGNTFVIGADGSIFNNNLNLLGSLSNFSNVYGSFDFSEDGTKLYASTTGQINVFSLPSLVLEKTIPARNKGRGLFNVGNNQLLIVADGFDNNTGSTTTLLEKINIVK